MRLSLRRIVFWGFPLVLLAAGLTYAFWPRSLEVDLVTARRGPLIVSADEEGETRVRDVFELSAPIAGRIWRIEAEVGDQVVAGETLLVQIEPVAPAFLDVRSEAEAEAAVRVAEAARDLAAAEVAEAEADLAFATTELDRIKRLIEREVVATRRLDEATRIFAMAQAKLETTKASLRARGFELEQAKTRLLSRSEIKKRQESCECVPLYAPATGSVLRVLRESEGVVSPGEPLIEIGDPSDLEIVADFLSYLAVKIEPGQRVIIEDWGGAEPLEGRVRRVEPFGFTKVSALGIEEQRVNVIIDFVDDPARWTRLGHGYSVDARVVLSEGSDVLKLPQTALFREGDDWAVFAVENGRAVLRPVELGRTNGLEAEILAGIEVGDTVIEHPSESVEDGKAVRRRG